MNGFIEDLLLSEKPEEQADIYLDNIVENMTGLYPYYVEFSECILRNDNVLSPVTNKLRVKDLSYLSHYLASRFIDDSLKSVNKRIPDDFNYSSAEEEVFNEFLVNLVDHYTPANKSITRVENKLNTCLNLIITLEDDVKSVYEDRDLYRGFIEYFTIGISRVIEEGVNRFSDSIGEALYKRLEKEAFILY